MKSLDYNDNDRVLKEAYEALQKEFYSPVNWDKFENTWESISSKFVNIDNDKDTSNKTEVICKEAAKGYLSLFRDGLFLRKASESIISSSDQNKTTIEQALKKSLANYEAATSMHTHETYWELRNLGHDHGKTFNIVADLIKELLIIHDKETGDNLKGNKWKVGVSRDALNEDMPPKTTYIVDGMESTSHKPRNITISAGEHTQRLLAKTPQITSDLERLVAENFGIKITHIRSGIGYQP